MKMEGIADAMGVSEHDVAVLRLAIRHGLDDPCQPFEVLLLHCSDVHVVAHTYFMVLLQASAVNHNA
jgi:hypothetical protein